MEASWAGLEARATMHCFAQRLDGKTKVYISMKDPFYANIIE